MKTPPTNRSWGRTLVGFLQASGVERVFLSPGARSSPVVAMLAESGMECITHYDERGMAFAALGCALASGVPAVCLTTSGSAVANLLPSCVEASQSFVPLVLLTADRPAELRGTGANQTIMQPGIFGGYVRFAVDVPCPEDVSCMEELLEPLAMAFQSAIGPLPGPVHVNLQFREPLLGDDLAPPLAIEPRLQDDHDEAFILPPGLDSFLSTKSGVVVVGRLGVSSQREADLIVALGRFLGWPVIADALSGVRHLPGVIRHADLLVKRGDVPAPDCVLHFGGSVVSKRVGEWISSCPAGNWLQVVPSGDRWDPWGSRPIVVSAGIGEFCSKAMASSPVSKDGKWAARWVRADSCVSDRLGHQLGGAELSEPLIARLVGQYADVVFLGNSMPVRDFDSFDCVARDGERMVFGNRGASGIDGNIATIAGIARGCGKPVVALIGDLAFLHDLNSLALLRTLPVTLVVVNNDGGGIFQFLPLAIPTPDRERLWETPHGMEFSCAANQFGIRYQQIANACDLEITLQSTPSYPRILECRTDRSRNHDLHHEISSAVAGLSLEWIE